MSSTGTALFGVGLSTPTMPSTKAFVVVDANIRCQGVYRGKACGRLLAVRAARPHTHVCRGCGHTNDSEDGSWRV